MERFHVIEDAAAVLVTKGGVYRQVKVYRRGAGLVGGELFAGHGSGFIRLYRGGTSVPTIRLDALDLPQPLGVSYDSLGRAKIA